MNRVEYCTSKIHPHFDDFNKIHIGLDYDLKKLYLKVSKQLVTQ